MSKLEECRSKIDAIDMQMVELFEKRMKITKEVGEYKKQNNLPVLDVKREQELLEKRIDMLSDKKYKDEIIRFFEMIMLISKENQ